MDSFSITGNQRLEFGPGAIMKVPEIAGDIRGTRGLQTAHLVLVSGGKSFFQSGTYGELMKGFGDHHFSDIMTVSIPAEPSPGMVDNAVREICGKYGREAALKNQCIVVAVGGGSALDAGKAIAAMLPLLDEKGVLPRVKDYLEVVGSKTAAGLTVPFIACPTTAGTGSESTKNAVLAERGEAGFKRSLRHDNYMPSAAVVDPALAVSCPRSVTAASGLDALTQLIEAWTSPRINPFMSDLIAGAVKAFAGNFEKALEDGRDIPSRSGLAYAAYISGLALANCGLGSVHAMASPVLGGRFDIPHGLVCGTLIRAGAEINIRKIGEALKSAAGAEKRKLENSLISYAHSGFLLSGNYPPENPREMTVAKIAEGTGLLLENLDRLIRIAELPPLKSFGFTEEHIPVLSGQCRTQTNPVPMDASDYGEMLGMVLR